MKYKLLLADIDGTLVPNLGMPPREYFPSDYLSQVVKRAHKTAVMSLCTGRDKQTVMGIVKKLHLFSPQIIEGGAKIIDARGKNLWVKYVSKSSVVMILSLLKETKTSFSVVIDGLEIIDTIPRNNIDKITAVLWYDLTQEQVTELSQKLSVCRDINVSANQDRTGNTLYITHKDGTKAHGVRKLLSILGVPKEKVIGVGDGKNDCPLLLECGLKIAMANAAPELKAIADFVAPSVEEDGVATVIEKFILS